MRMVCLMQESGEASDDGEWHHKHAKASTSGRLAASKSLVSAQVPRIAPVKSVQPAAVEGTQEQKREDAERQNLAASLRQLVKQTSFSDVMKSLETVCKDLKQAIKKLEKLLRQPKVCHCALAKASLALCYKV